MLNKNIPYELSPIGVLETLYTKTSSFPTPENRLRRKLTIARNVVNTLYDKILETTQTQYDEPGVSPGPRK